MVVHKCAPFHFLVFISEGGAPRGTSSPVHVSCLVSRNAETFQAESKHGAVGRNATQLRVIILIGCIPVENTRVVGCLAGFRQCLQIQARVLVGEFRVVMLSYRLDFVSKGPSRRVRLLRVDHRIDGYHGEYLIGKLGFGFVCLEARSGSRPRSCSSRYQ